jgi:DNA-binding CsgD family transcriptional regulator
MKLGLLHYACDNFFRSQFPRSRSCARLHSLILTVYFDNISHNNELAGIFMITSEQLPGLCAWKKNREFSFVEMNNTCAQLFGFGHPASAIGKRDFDIPSGLCEFAETFIENDRKIMQTGKTTHFIEIQPCMGNQWKVLHVVKSLLVEDNQLSVLGYCVDVTSTFFYFEQFVNARSRFYDKRVGSFTIVRDHETLTTRQLECLFYLLRGKTAKQIGNLLKISSRTVEHYIEGVKDAFGCVTKSDLIDYAIKNNLISIIPESILRYPTSVLIECNSEY